MYNLSYYKHGKHKLTKSLEKQLRNLERAMLGITLRDRKQST